MPVPSKCKHLCTCNTRTPRSLQGLGRHTPSAWARESAAWRSRAPALAVQAGCWRWARRVGVAVDRAVPGVTARVPHPPHPLRLNDYCPCDNATRNTRVQGVASDLRHGPRPPGPMSSKGQGLLNRHEEIRLALRFFLQKLQQHKEAGTIPDKAQTLYDFARYKGLQAVVDRLSTRAPQIKPAPRERDS